MRWSGITLRIVVCLCLSAALGCASVSPRERLLRDGIHNIEGYAFDPSSPIESRVAEIPAATLKALMWTDRRSDYLAYMPSGDERRMLADYWERLPAANRRVMQESLVRIYFIRNFVGAGMTDFVLSGDRRVYAVLYLNPAVFTKGISEWLTFRENSFFSPDASGTRVEIDCGAQYTALMYVLLHESAHVVDYVHPVTPFVDRGFAEAQGLSGRKTPFVAGVWEDYDVLARDFDITENRDLHAYGMAPPAIGASQMRALYDKIFRSPLVSGYAATNWAEDFADSVAFYHLTRELKQPYTVTISEHGKVVSVHRPMESPQVQRRWKIIEGVH
jgi:hypothetical protein